MRRAADQRRSIAHIARGGEFPLRVCLSNGRFIGLSKDAHLPAEFDLTDGFVDAAETQRPR